MTANTESTLNLYFGWASRPRICFGLDGEFRKFTKAETRVPRSHKFCAMCAVARKTQRIFRMKEPFFWEESSCYSFGLFLGGSAIVRHQRKSSAHAPLNILQPFNFARNARPCEGRSQLLAS
jgi:hypothetical protein